MKRSEMLEHIEEELKEFLVNYENASEKARPHKIRSAADGILAMVEGLGMEPPLNFDNMDNEWEIVPKSFGTSRQAKVAKVKKEKV